MSPGPRGWGRGGRLPYLSRPVRDPWGRVTAGALPYLRRAAQTLSGSGKHHELLLRIYPGLRGSPGTLGEWGWVGCINSLRQPGLAVEWVDCSSGEGGLRIFIGVGLRRGVLPYFSRVTLAPGIGKVVRWGRVGGVCSSGNAAIW